MTREKLIDQINLKKSLLCVGLDTDLNKIPPHLRGREDAIFEFNKAIIDATAAFSVAYKPNIAFYECLGSKGWIELEKTVDYLKGNYPELFLIADAKRGDIGNTSKMYAKTFFEKYNFDAVTVAPYMGEDSIKPFLEYEEKWTIVLGLTSNMGSNDFQHFRNINSVPLYETVLEKVSLWGSPNNTMFVVGATRSDMLTEIRSIVPDHFLLVPGVGAQGGSLAEAIKNGKNKDKGLIINSSRSIIYAGQGKNFAMDAANEARNIQQQMRGLIS